MSAAAHRPSTNPRRSARCASVAAAGWRWSLLAPLLLLALLPRALAADLALGASASTATVNAGANVVFTLNVTNLGPGTATDVALTNLLSPYATFLSATSTQGSCTNEGSQVTCLAGNLAADAHFTVTLTVRAGPGTNACAAVVAADDADPAPENNTAHAAAVGTQTLAPLSNTDLIAFEEIDASPGSVYPSIIHVSGLTGHVHKVTVVLHMVSHSNPDDLDLLLVAPDGRNVMLMSDCGLDGGFSDITITLDDDAAAALPDSLPTITTGTYRPANYGSVVLETMDPPAPPRPYGATLSVFQGSNPNGDWRLFALDDSPEDGGFIAEGWTLRLVTSEPIADLAVTSTANVASLPVGSNLTYTITVTNRGPAAAPTTLLDALPSTAAFVSASTTRGSCAHEAGVLTCPLGQLASGASARVTLVVAPTLGGPITNLASVTGSTFDNIATNNAASLVTTVFPVSDLALEITAPGTALLLEPVACTFALTNLGPNEAGGVAFTNTLPAGATFLSAVTSQGSCTHNAGIVTCQVGVLGPGAGARIVVESRPQVLGLRTNFARVVSPQLDFVPANNLAQAVTEILPSADLSLATQPIATTILFGQDWTETLFITNRGPQATTATVTSQLPAVLNFVSAMASQGSCSHASGTLVCDLGTMETNQFAIISLVTRPGIFANVTNTFAVTGGLGDPSPSNNLAAATAIVLANADLGLSVTPATNLVWLGNDAAYTFIITNHGPNDATSVTLTNTLPVSLNFISAVPDQGSCVVEGKTVSCQLGTLSVGDTLSVAFVVHPVASGIILNGAQVHATEADAQPANGTITPVLHVLAATTFPSGPLTIPQAGPASVYPSTFQVSGLTTAVSRVRVTLTNLAHSYPDDLDLLLVGPNGHSTLLLSDSGGEFAVNNVNLVFDADASTPLPDAGPLTSGAFRATDYEGNDTFPAPAPPGPYAADLSVFHDSNPNGAWSLYIVDDATKDSGSLAGWSLTLGTLDPIADLQLVQQISGNPTPVGSNWVVTFNITNHGPANAGPVRVTNILAGPIRFVSAVASQGACNVNGAVLSCSLGTLPSGAQASIVLTTVPTNAATITQSALVTSAQRDLVPLNNTTGALIEALDPPAFTVQPVSLMVTNGDPVLFLASVFGSPPLSLQWQRNGVDVPGATNATFEFIANPRNAGSYRLRAANVVGVTFSDTALLQVLGPPSISDLADRVLDEDSTTGPLAFTLEDAESPAGLITLSADSSDTNLVALSGIVFGGSGSNRTVQVTPQPNATGQAVISVIATDPDLLSSTNSFLLTVSPVNDPPSIAALTNRVTVEDTAIVIPFVADDLETPPDSLVYSLTSSDPALVGTSSAVFAGTGTARTLTFTPATNFNGSATLSINAADGSNSVASSSFLLTVTPVNDRPTLDAIADRAVAEDSGVQTITLVGIGPGAANESQFLSVRAHSGQPGIIPDPAVTYTNPATSAELRFTPAANATGAVLIIVTITDGNATNESFSRVFTIDVTPVNDPPTLVAPTAVSLDEDAAISIPIVVADADDDLATVSLSAFSSNATVVGNGGFLFDGTGALRSLLITPQLNAPGSTVISVVATDPQGASSTNSFPLTLAPVNDLPTLNLLTDRALPEDSPAQNVPLAGISSGAANEVQTLTVTAVSSNPALIPNPSVSYTSPASTGTLTFRPNTNATGTALITVSVSDGTASFTRSFTVTLTPANDPPSLSPIAAQSTIEDTALALPITVGDAETSAALLTLSASSSNPGLIAATNITFDGAASNRTVLLQPIRDQHGAADITVWVSDGAASNSTTFALTVAPVNDAPTINFIATFVTNAASGNPAFVVAFNGIGSGAANENESLNITATSSNPVLMPNPTVSYNSPNTNGTLTLRPDNNSTGTSVITVTVNDGGASNNTVVQTFLANIKASGNALPTLSIITNRVTTEDTPTPSLAFTVRDSQTPAANLTVLAFSSNPVLLPTNNIALTGSGTNRSLILTPAPNQAGLAAITLTVLDDASGSSNMTFSLTVTPVNDAPVISAITNRTTSEDISIAIPFPIGDVETAAASLQVSATSGNTTLVPNGNLLFGGNGTNRSLLITPATNQSGSAAITVRVTDGFATNTSAFTLTVTAVNDLPSISSLAPITTPEDTPAGPFNFTVGDVETAAGSLTATAGSSNPSLIAVADITLAGAGANRTLAFTPRPGAFGAALLTLTVTDGGGASTNTSIAVSVTTVNDPPTLDAITNVVVNESSALRVVPLTGLGTGDPGEGQGLTVSATASTNRLATLSVDYSGSGATGTLAFLPVPGATGAVEVTVTVDDGQPTNHLASRVFTITINAAPRIAYLPDQTTSEDIPISVPIPIADAESLPAQITVTATSSSSLVPPAGILLSGNGAQRTLTLTPAPNRIGNALITVTATDPGGAASSNSFHLTVISTNVPPSLNPIASYIVNPASGPFQVPLTGIGPGAAYETEPVSLTAESSDTNRVTVVSLSHPSGSSVAVLTLLPVGTTGSSLITVIANDGQGASNLTTRAFTVTLNSRPVIAPISSQSTREQTATAPILIAVSDAQSAASNLVVTAASTNALLPPQAFSITGTGAERALVIRPAPGTGEAFVTVTVTDPQGLAASTTFPLTVISNHPPTLDAIPTVLLNPGASPHLVPLTGIGPGASNEFDVVTLSATSSDTNHVVVAGIDHANNAATATLTLLPVGTNGSALITVIANDGQPTNHLTTRVFTAAFNTPPVISLFTNQSTLEDTATVPQSFIISDAETPAAALTLSGLSLPLESRFFFTGSTSNRAVSVLAQTNANGLAHITIVVTDPQGLSASNSFDILISPVQDPLQIVQQPQNVNSGLGQTATFNVVAISAVPLTYQWRRAGASIPGATNASLVLSNLMPSAAGTYDVLVRNADEASELSQPAELQVNTQPYITGISRTGQTAEVFFLTVPGATNTLEMKTPVNAPGWIPIGGITATNDLMSIPDPDATNAFRFYRIRRD